MKKDRVMVIIFADCILPSDKRGKNAKGGENCLSPVISISYLVRTQTNGWTVLTNDLENGGQIDQYWTTMYFQFFLVFFWRFCMIDNERMDIRKDRRWRTRVNKPG